MTYKDKSIILLLGQEKLLKDKIIDEIKREYIQNKFSEDFNFNVFYGKDVTLTQILDTANTLPVMSDKRIVIVYNFDEVAKYKTILEFYPDPSESTILILTSDNEQYYYAFDKNFQKKFKAIYKKKGELKIFYQMKDIEIKNWIKAEFQSQHKQAGDDVAEYLLGIIGSNLYDLHNEINKINNFLGKKEKINVEDIRRIVSNNFSISLDSLFDAISQKNTKKALEFFDVYYQKKEPLLLLTSALQKFFRKLMYAKYLMDYNGYSTDQIFNMKKEFGLYYFNRTQFFKALNGYSYKTLVNILTYFFTLDSILKSYKSAFIKVYFERFLIRICRKLEKK